VTFPLVLEEKRLGRGLDSVLRECLLVNFGMMTVLLVRVRRREDTYGDRDAGVKVQGASLSDSPGFLVVTTLS